MSIGFFIPDGRDFSSVFPSGNSGQATGFYNSSGQDLGYIFAGGNSGITTGFKRSNGGDVGEVLGIVRNVDETVFSGNWSTYSTTGETQTFSYTEMDVTSVTYTGYAGSYGGIINIAGIRMEYNLSRADAYFDYTTKALSLPNSSSITAQLKGAYVSFGDDERRSKTGLSLLRVNGTRIF